MLTFKKVVAVCLSLVLTVVLTVACSKKEETGQKTVFKIAYLPITHSVPLFIQKEMLPESDVDFDIELVKFQSWPELVDALRLKKVDGASMLFELAIKASENNNALKLLSLSHRDGNVLTVANDIKSVQDLRGKKVAIPHKISPHNSLLHMLLEQEGMTIDDVEVVEMAPAEMPFSLASNSVSGYLVAEPFGAISVIKETGKVLKYSKDFAPDSICCVMVFNNDIIEKNQSNIKQFMDTFDKAAERADKKDDFVVNTFKKYNSAESAVLKQSLDWTKYENLKITEDEYTKVTDLIKKYKIIDIIPEYKDFVYQPVSGE